MLTTSLTCNFSYRKEGTQSTRVQLCSLPISIQLNPDSIRNKRQFTQFFVSARFDDSTSDGIKHVPSVADRINSVVTSYEHSGNYHLKFSQIKTLMSINT